MNHYRALYITVVLLLVLCFSSIWARAAEDVDIFTPEERLWLEAHPVLRIAATPTNPVAEFRDENGNWVGMVPDYISLIEENLGIEFEVVEYDLWEEALEAGRNREVDVFPDLIQSTERDEYLVFTEPIIEVPVVVIVVDDFEGNVFERAITGLKIAAVPGTPEHDFLDDLYSQLEIVSAPDPATALMKVSMEEVDAYVVDMMTASYYTQDQMITNLKIGADTGYAAQMRMACRSDWPELAGILQKAMDSISPEEFQALYDKWIYLAEGDSDSTWEEIQSLFFPIAGGIAAVILGFIIWNTILRRQVMRRTVELEYQLIERKRAVEALRESEEKTRSILDSSPDAITVTDREGKIIECNQATLNLHGFQHKEKLIGISAFDLFAAEEKARAAVNMQETLEKGTISNLEYTLIRKDGSQFPADLSASVIRDADGNPVSFIAVTRDITDRKQAEEDATRIKALEETDRLRKSLVASVSHELRTPLAAIKGIADTLIQPDVQWDDETQQDFLRTINRESDKLTHIVNDLVEMSQLEIGMLKVQKYPSMISALAIHLKDQLKYSTQKHELQVDLPRDLPPVEMDEIRVGEVITNLISNAASYSDEGSKITLSAEQIDGKVMVSVTDEGVGIPSNELERVFDRFHRLEFGTARRRGGIGLGLAISKEIVAQHGGRIWAESREGCGSRFNFTLPILDMTEDADVEADDPSQDLLDTEKVEG